MINISEANSPVADAIPVYLKEKGIKAVFVADKVGISASQFADSIAGRRLIKVCEIPKIAAALGVTPNDLYGINESVTP